MVVIGVMKLTLGYGEVYQKYDPPSLKIHVENGAYLKEIHPVEQKIQPKCFFPLMVPFF